MSKTLQTLTVTECHQLLDHLLPKDCAHSKFEQGLRNFTMAMLMLETGIRVGELVQLLIQDLILQEEPVTMLVIRAEIAKRGHERLVPVSERLRNALAEIHNIVWRRNDPNPHGPAFYASNPLIPITARQVQRIIKYNSLLSIGRAIHPHVLRHTFASRLMRKTNSRIVQELLGHKNLTSTQIYQHPNNDDLKQAIDSLGCE